MKKKLSFGTAGIRGIMKDGDFGINKVTVSRVASGYADYLNSLESGDAKIIIGHDTRHGSYLFAEIIAKVLTAKKIKAYLYKDNQIAPTPLVSYTIIKRKFSGAVMITASHNPKEYNGIKVYDNTGKQLLPAETSSVSKFVESTTIPNYENEKILYIEDDIIDEYLKDLENIEVINEEKKIKIAYCPVQGTGILFIERLFVKYNYEYFVVKKQMIEDPNFKNSSSLNPEEDIAYDQLIETAKTNDCEVAFISDPDADRVGLAIRDEEGEYRILNGNEVAALYLDFIIKQLSKDHLKNSYVATTVPSGHLPQDIAKAHGVSVYKTHVGFKNIAHVIETHSKEKMLLAYEESFGSVIDKNITRDKDSFQAIIAYAEMVNHYYINNINCITVLNNLYKKYGYILNKTLPLVIDKKQQDTLFGNILRTKEIAGYKIKKVENYNKGLNNLYPQNLLKIYFNNDAWIAIRPSGTEPKVKVYIESKSKSKQEALSFIDDIENYVRSHYE